VDSLCHPWFTTANLSYRFPIFETSGTTGKPDDLCWYGGCGSSARCKGTPTNCLRGGENQTTRWPLQVMTFQQNHKVYSAKSVNLSRWCLKIYRYPKKSIIIFLIADCQSLDLPIFRQTYDDSTLKTIRQRSHLPRKPLSVDGGHSGIERQGSAFSRCKRWIVIFKKKCHFVPIAILAIPSGNST